MSDVNASAVDGKLFLDTLRKPRSPAPPAEVIVRTRSVDNSAEFTPVIMELKQRLVAARAVRDQLRDALAKIAPDHPLVSPLQNNPLLKEVANAATERIQAWDDPI